jgi:hypothetical protein
MKSYFEFYEHNLKDSVLSPEVEKDYKAGKLKDKYFVARCIPLGLTAYGDTQAEANDKLVRMFGSYMSAFYKYKDEK